MTTEVRHNTITPETPGLHADTSILQSCILDSKFLDGVQLQALSDGLHSVHVNAVALELCARRQSVIKQLFSLLQL